MAYVLLFSFSLFASILMVGIADSVYDICPMEMSSQYSTAARFCTKEIQDKTDKAVPCKELYSLFKKICSFNKSIIAQAVPMTVTNDSCMILLANLDAKYIPFILNMTNGRGTIMTLCETHPDASAVLLALYQLKHLIHAKEEESEPNQADVISNTTGEKSPTKQSAVTANDTVTRPTSVSTETPSTKSTTASSTTATRGSDPISTISNVTSTTTPSMPYTTAKEFKSQPTEKAAITVNATGEERNSSTEPAVLRTNNTAAESPDPASNSSAVKSSSTTTTTTTTTTTIAAATTIAGPKNKNIKTNITSDVPEGPKNKNIKTNITSDVPEEAGNDSTGKNDEDNEAGNDSSEKNEEYELTTNNPGKKDDTADSAEKVDTNDPAEKVDTNDPAEKVDTNDPAEKVDTNDPAEKVDTNDPAEKVDTNDPAEKVDTSKLEDNPSSYNFLIYFLAFIVLCVAVYIVLHNKHKIIAFIIEGKQGRRGGRPSTKQYTPLKSKVEDVMPFIEKSTTQSNYIY